jgi:membrane-associated HD superfamily phosphohydrolase
VIQKKFLDGQLDECHLTLKDLTKVEESFVRILLGIYHQRIDYPKTLNMQAASFSNGKGAKNI